MTCKPRLNFPGAFVHVIARSDQLMSTVHDRIRLIEHYTPLPWATIPVASSPNAVWSQCEAG
jgi:hypothetical protein